MKCRICQNEFTPDKYHPRQSVCSQPACQKQRQLENLSAWRQKNPDYFKGLEQDAAWREKRRNYNKLWKKANQKEIKEYAKKNKEQRREYMRFYMQEYRRKAIKEQ